jgi:sigma-54 dependent transcriptional regulator, acetoin dehydrogenase operon transcriptional activator AcoR
MSRAHARIVRDGANLVLEDAGSTNGTSVNGQPITSHVLRHGDVVELGDTILLYREDHELAAGRARSLATSATATAPGFATLDPELAHRLGRLARVAPSPLSILLVGETGTGKEILARGLHTLSLRPGPFVAVNCGAIPHNLVEANLFGHVRGAFSGALKDEPGLVRAGDHGTLLLDEIGDLPWGAQAALLRVLQEGEVQPVGSAHTTKVDVRVIAATHMPLAELVERGAFRRDLYARLAGYTFQLAPLRERVVDLGLLIAALLDAGKLGARRDLRLHGDAAHRLLRHDWPMNVRELEKCLHAASLLTEDGVITADDVLPPRSTAPDLTPHLPPAGRPVPPAVPGAAEPGAADDRRALLVALLAEHAGNVSAVARELRTSRTHVHRLIARYAIASKPA